MSNIFMINNLKLNSQIFYIKYFYFTKLLADIKPMNILSGIQ